MMILSQLFIGLLIWMIVIGSLLNPELRTYSTQLIALLLLFYIILRHIQDYIRRKELKKASHDEDTILFLSTYIKPKLIECSEDVNLVENHRIVGKKLEIIINEIDQYLEDEEKDV